MARSKSVVYAAMVLVLIGLLTGMLRLIAVLKTSWLLALSPFIAALAVGFFGALSIAFEDRKFSARITRSDGLLPKPEIERALRKALLIAGVQKDLAYKAYLAGEIDLPSYGDEEFDRETVARFVNARYMRDPIFFWEMVDRGIIALVDRNFTQVKPM